MYREKYLKYKSKYLDLKNQVSFAQGGSIKRVYQKGGVGQIVTVIKNNGTIEGMTMQCMWISIFDYLQRRPGGAGIASVRALRAIAGLDASTENKMFDSDDPIFVAAINRVATTLGIRIMVFRVTIDGKIQYDAPTAFNNIPGLPLVRIAQYGLAHFELITGIYDTEPDMLAAIAANPALGVKFKGAIPVKGVFDESIDTKLQGIYQSVIAENVPKLSAIREAKRLHQARIKELDSLKEANTLALSTEQSKLVLNHEMIFSLIGKMDTYDEQSLRLSHELLQIDSDLDGAIEKMNIDADRAVAEEVAKGK